MSALITILHVIICLVLIVAVLLQSGKAADLAGAFGGAGSATAFGPRGTASLMSKVTEIGAILFMLTSLTLWVLSGKSAKSAVSDETAAPIKPPAASTETGKPAAVGTDAAKTPAEQVVPKTEAQKPTTTIPVPDPKKK